MGGRAHIHVMVAYRKLGEGGSLNRPRPCAAFTTVLLYRSPSARHWPLTLQPPVITPMTILWLRLRLLWRLHVALSVMILRLQLRQLPAASPVSRVLCRELQLPAPPPPPPPAASAARGLSPLAVVVALPRTLLGPPPPPPIAAAMWRACSWTWNPSAVCAPLCAASTTAGCPCTSWSATRVRRNMGRAVTPLEIWTEHPPLPPLAPPSWQSG